MMIHLATYFDKNYLSRGLVLYDSLQETAVDFELYVLCLDEFVNEFFQTNTERYPRVKTVLLSDIEKDDADLVAAKGNRSKIEYYFTLSPCLPLYLIKKFNLPHICTLDADILFFSSPKFIFEYLKDYSIIITPHKFSKQLISLELWGSYNVSFQIFKNNETGLKCLEYWRKQCIEWCGDDYDEENHRFADQKYLDNWPNLYPNEVCVLNDDVSGIAPWNLNKYKIEKKDGAFLSNGHSLVFYHFHHFKIFDDTWASNGFKEYKVVNQRGVDDLYAHYWNKLDKYNKELVISTDSSSRFVFAQKLMPRLLKETKVYKRINSKELKVVSYAFIPKFIRKLIIKCYA